MAIGIAASKTCPTFRPRNAAAAEKIAAMTMPSVTDRGVNSWIAESAGTIGW
jgi:hypothetical protein